MQVGEMVQNIRTKEFGKLIRVEDNVRRFVVQYPTGIRRQAFDEIWDVGPWCFDLKPQITPPLRKILPTRPVRSRDAKRSTKE